MQKHLQHRFVESVPTALDAGILYISVTYGTVIHSCCCGCGEEIVTPLTPEGWKINYDGETISLWPSVGNWKLPCRSHYVIDRNRVITGESRLRSYGEKLGREPKCETGVEPKPSEDRGRGVKKEANLSVWRKINRWLGRLNS